MALVMAFGSFDPLHDGHRDYFRQAREAGGEGVILVVVVARDSSIQKMKRRRPHKTETERLAIVALEHDVDEAILGDPDDFLAVIEKQQPDILFLGYDQQTFSDEELRKRLEARGLEPRILKGEPFQPEKYKSSKLRD